MTNVSRDSGTKKYAYKGSREDASLHYYSQVDLKICRDAPCQMLSLLPLYVYFLVPPSLLMCLPFLELLFILVVIHFFSVMTEDQNIVLNSLSMA